MENAIALRPAVAEPAVVGMPHPRRQERPVAVIVVRPGVRLSEQEIRAHLAERFASWQLPDTVVFTDAIARTSVGKIDKTNVAAC